MRHSLQKAIHKYAYAAAGIPGVKAAEGDSFRNIGKSNEIQK